MTGIEWTDAVWNPTTGCDRVSPGCDHCYAMTMAKRLKGMGQAKYQTDGNPRTSGPGFGLAMHADVLDLPLSWKKPRRVFVNSMSDLFHDSITNAFIVEVFARMWWSPKHTFQVLTKRHGRMRSLVPRIEEHLRQREQDLALVDCPTPLTWPLPNVWLGVSVENQTWADIRIPALLETPAAVRWLSCEPLLGSVNLHRWFQRDDPDGECAACGNETWVDYGKGHPKVHYCVDGECTTAGSPDCPDAGQTTGEWCDGPVQAYPRPDWVVTGGESGPGARPMHPDWVRSLRDQCASAEVPFFFKQWGEYAPATLVDDPRYSGGRAVIDPRGGRIAASIRERGPSRTFRAGVTRPLRPGDQTSGGLVMLDHDTVMVRMGKGGAGRLLDGELHDAYPVVA